MKNKRYLFRSRRMLDSFTLWSVVVLCAFRCSAQEVFDAEPLFTTAWNDMEQSDDFDAEGPILQVSLLEKNSSLRRYPVASRTFSWRDSTRKRTIPVKLFYPSSENVETYPVIVFSHGLGGSFNRCSYLGTAWASRGFVVAAVQHPGSDENVWKGKVRVLNELRESYKYNWNGRTRAEDLHFVLDRLDALAAEGTWIGSKFDRDRIGVGGYDLGALASLLLAGQLPPDGRESLHDPRIKAVLAMSPPVNRARDGYENVYAAVDVPAFFITGTEDDGIVGSTKASQRRIPFDFMSDNDRYLVVFRGADHQIYGGPIFSISLRARNDRRFQSAIVQASSCFWLAHLAGNEPFLETLNDYGLHSMIGGMARIERRVSAVKSVVEIQADGENEASVPPDVERDATNRAETKPVAASTIERETQALFPLTRYYRAIVSKYETKKMDVPE